MKRCLFILLILLAAIQTAGANDKDPNELLLAKWDAVIEDPNDPNELLQAKWDAVTKVLQSEDLDQNVKEKIIDKIISPIFDFSLMGKLALGRTHWPKLTQPQREKFTLLFAKRLKDSYREKISLYTDEKALLKPAIQNKKGVFIPMQLLSVDRKIDILYKLRKVDKCWKVYDVEIQGVSIVLTYRSQFNDILRKGTVEDILSKLEKLPTP
ncbi:MAG: ABC transporter substrate-binding protein [Phycisphaerae bacterium]|nr:ABC transporter substrate-binding protein [Phycisphaerae bacterium]